MTNNKELKRNMGNNEARANLDISKFTASYDDGFTAVIKNEQRFHDIANTMDRNQHLYLLVAGTSESGKSYLGARLVQDEVANRLKIYKVLGELIENRTLILPGHTSLPNPFEGASTIAGLDHDKQTEIVNSIVNRFIDITKSHQPVSVVETVKHPWIIEKMRARDDLQSLVVFIDAPFEKRVERQSLKMGQTFEETRRKVDLKDITKSSYGNLLIKDLADLEIWNAGSISTYDDYINIIENALPIISGQKTTTIEYS